MDKAQKTDRKGRVHSLGRCIFSARVLLRYIELEVS